MPDDDATRDRPTLDIPTPYFPLTGIGESTVPGSAPEAETAPSDVGQYEVVGTIARGGMGVVYRARDPRLNREVAVKLIRTDYRAVPAAVRRFLDEAVITGQLQHPGIPPVHEVGTLPDGSPFLAMKFIKGRTLEDLLKDRPDPAADRGRFVAIFEYVCQAVGYAHTHQVIHRDLKPANVMVGAFGEVQVMDWGLAKVLIESIAGRNATNSDESFGTEIHSLRGEAAMTQAGSLLGTPSFMPPEQAMGAIDEVDARSDVFGLGAILCVILTGQPPYTGTDAETVRKAAVRAQQEEAQARLAACGAEAELIALCRRCLSPEKGDRPRDAGDVAAAVAAFRADAENRARRAELDRVQADADRVAAAVKATAERKWWRAQLALATTAVLVVGLAGVGAWWGQKQIDDRARLESDRAAERAMADAEQKSRRERVRTNVRDAIDRAAGFRGQWLWDQAENLLAQAAGQLDPVDDSTTAAEVAAARRDTKFLARLFEIRMAKAGADGQYHNEDALPAYDKAFREYGFDLLNGNPAELAKRLKASAVWSELLVALDDWAWTASIVAGQRVQGEQVWAVTSAATGEANRPGRQTADFKDPAAILKFVETMPTAELTPSLVSFLTVHMEQLGGDKVAVLEAGIRRHPTDFWMHFELGWAYWFGKPRRLDSAIGAFRTSVALRPNVPAARSFLSEALAQKANETGRKPESKTEATLRDRIKLNPDDFVARRELGLTLFHAGDFVGAVEAFQELARRQPDVAANHQMLGESFRWAKRPRESVAAQREAVRIAPESMFHVAQLAIALSLNGETAESVRLMRRAIDHPTEPQTYLYSHLGNTYEAAAMYPEAVGAFRNAVRYYALNSYDWQRLSQVSLKAKDFETSAAAAREAIRLDPAESFNSYCLALALEALGDRAGAAAAHRRDAVLCRGKGPEWLDHAITCFRKALAQTPRDATLHHEIAVTHLEKNDLSAADAAAQDALRLDPNLAAAHALRGDIARRQFRHGDSLAAYEAAVRNAPANLGHLHSRAAALHNLGRVTEAEAGYRDVLRRNPDRELSHLNLGNLLRNKGDFDGAVASFREVIRINPKLLAGYSNLAFAYRMNARLPEAVATMRKAVEVAPNDANARQHLAFVEKLLATEHALPAILAGTKDLPEADAVTYAQFCLMARPGKFARAYRLYARVPEPKFPHAYNAACAAVLLAAGRDSSAPDVSLDEWYYLMGRARGWMAADLAELKNQLKDPQRQMFAKSNLRQHLVDPDLAPVRDPIQLKLMPDPDEREKWVRFWADARQTADAASVPWREPAPIPRESK